MEEYREFSEARLGEIEDSLLRSFKGSPSEMEELRMISKARQKDIEEYKEFSEARLREMEELVLMSFKGSLSEMEELQRMISKARWKVVQEYRTLSEERLREMEELVLMSFKGSPSEMEELERMIARARREAMEEYIMFSVARLREMEDYLLRSFKGSPSEMEELQGMISKIRREVMEEYREFCEARLRAMEELVLRARSFKGSPSEMDELEIMISGARQKGMEEYREFCEARLRAMEELGLRAMSFKGSPSEIEEFQGMISKVRREVMEEYRNFFEARLREMEELVLMSFKGSPSEMEELQKMISKVRQEAMEASGAEADKAGIQGQEYYEQGSFDDDSSGQTSEMTEEDFSHEIHDLQLKDQEEPDKVEIFKGTVTSNGFHLDLNVGAIHLTFPPDTVAEPTGIMVYRWKYGACLPQLMEHEAVVSTVIEICAATEVGSLKFNSEVKLVLSHSGADLEGYELVMKRLTDMEKNEWEEIARCEDIRQASDIDDYPCPNNVPYSFPVVSASITKCSTYAVVSRLKLSPTYTITVSGGTFVHPGYPQVTITIPEKAVETETRLSLQVKVQEVPQDEFQGHGLVSGPILRILCSSRVTLLEPVTIQLPVSLGNKLLNIPQPSECCVRIFFLSSERETREWVEISDRLENPASYDGKVVQFMVRGFSGFTFLLGSTIGGSSVVAFGIIAYLSSIIWKQPLAANFFAYFDPNERIDSRDILFLICCPAHRRGDVKQELEREGLKASEVTSRRDMIPGRDKAFVFVSGVRPASPNDLEGFYLRFDGNMPHKGQLQVCLASDKVYCKVEFRDTPNTTENKNLLSTLNLRLSSPCVDRQVSPFSNASAPPLEEAQKGYSSSTSNRKLKLTLLSSEWGSTKGGLSTINRELAIQLAKDDKVDVCMYLPGFSDEDKKAADDCRVRLLKAKKKTGYDPIDWLASVPSDHQMDVVIGHGIHLGRQVSLLREAHQECKWVQVVHTDPEELGMVKNYTGPTVRGEKKHQAEVELCQEADLVVAVGPKLADTYSHSCEREKVFVFTPGIFTEFTDINQDTHERTVFHVLVFGRGDREDFRLKGYDIAARAVAELKDEEPHFKLVFVGAPSGKEEEIKQMFLNEGIFPGQLIVRTAKEREQLAQQFFGADLVIMPSRTEGFGLTALEALSAGLPVLVSGNSGFGQALNELPFGKLVVINSEDPKEWAKEIKAVRRKRREVRLEEAIELREKYAKKYQWAGQCRSLIARMHEIL